MKKNKFQKGKSLAIAVFGLAAVAVVGVGFSSWVISFSQTGKVENVTLTVADIEDGSVYIVNEQKTDDSFVFDAANSATTGTVTHGGTTSEDLDIEFKFDLLYRDAKKIQNVKAVMTPVAPSDDDDGAATLNAYKAGASLLTTGNLDYVVQPLAAEGSLLTGSNGTLTAATNLSGVSVSIGETVAQTENENDSITALVNQKKLTGDGWNTTTVTVTLGFAWGDAFEVTSDNAKNNSDSNIGKNVNPAIYFNSTYKNKTNTTEWTYDDIAGTTSGTLTKLHQMSGVKFRIDLTTNK